MPVNAFSIEKADENSVTYINGKSVITTSIVSDKIISQSTMKKDLNNINKIVVKVDNKTILNINKVFLKKYKFYPRTIDFKTVVKGNIKGKNIKVFVYNNKNKLIKYRNDKLKSVTLKNTGVIKKYPKNARLSYNQAFKSAGEDLPSYYTLKYAGYYYHNGVLYWKFVSFNKKTGDGIDFSLSDLNKELSVGL